MEKMAKDGDPAACWEKLGDALAAVTWQIEKTTKTLWGPEPSAPTTHWEHKVTGQRIPIEELMLSTLIWPLDTVLEMVP